MSVCDHLHGARLRSRAYLWHLYGDALRFRQQARCHPKENNALGGFDAKGVGPLLSPLLSKRSSNAGYGIVHDA